MTMQELNDPDQDLSVVQCTSFQLVIFIACLNITMYIHCLYGCGSSTPTEHPPNLVFVGMFSWYWLGPLFQMSCSKLVIMQLVIFHFHHPLWLPSRLMLKSIGIDDLLHFDFMDPPPPETLIKAWSSENPWARTPIVTLIVTQWVL